MDKLKLEVLLVKMIQKRKVQTLFGIWYIIWALPRSAFVSRQNGVIKPALSGL